MRHPPPIFFSRYLFLKCFNFFFFFFHASADLARRAATKSLTARRRRRSTRSGLRHRTHPASALFRARRLLRNHRRRVGAHHRPSQHSRQARMDGHQLTLGNQQLPSPTASPVLSLPCLLAYGIASCEVSTLNFLYCCPHLCHINMSSTCAITLPLGNGHANSVQLAVTTQRPARRAVCDFSAWLEAWTVYLSIMTQHHPDRVSELIGYQHLILDAHQQFKTESVLNYDSAFRSYMAENPHARWDQVNTTLWSTKMLQGVRPSCPQCTKTHSRDRCTMHRTSNPQPFRTSTAPQAGRDEVCLNFNRGRPCFFQPCRLRHSCRTCGERGHGAYQCRKKGPHSATPSTRQPQQ